MYKYQMKEYLSYVYPKRLMGEGGLRYGMSSSKYNVKGDEDFLQGDFPVHPVVAVVILCEMLGQSACVLLIDQARGMTPMFTGLDKVKFRNPVLPGDTLLTTCEIIRQRGNFYFAKGKGTVDGKLAVSAEFSFALVSKEEA